MARVKTSASRPAKPPPPASRPQAAKPLPRETGLVAIAACFFFSGAASLVLEVVWTRLLRLTFGSTTLAVSTVLVAYMLGLGIGGLLGARAAKRLRDGVRAYGWIEIGIGVYALAVPLLLGALPAVNFALAGALSFWPAALCRFALALAVLLLPTILMGATLPVLVEALVRRNDELARRVGLLYGLNTLGAVAGVLGVSFVLFPLLGVARANLAAALADVAIGAAALLVLAPRRESAMPAPAAPAAGAKRVSLRHPALLAYAVVGFTSLSYEVCWTRALSMILGSSLYAFSSMLAAFLAGIALGSLIARRWLDRLARPLVAYALGIGALGLLALLTLIAFRELPSLFVATVLRLGTSPLGLSTTHVAISAVAMLGPTLLLGALFPLLVRALAGGAADASQAVGAAYFANTIGSASGAFAAGFVLIPRLGLQHTVGLAVALDFVAAALLLLWQSEWRAWPSRALAAVAMAAAILVLAVPPGWSPEELVRGVYLAPQRPVDVRLTPPPLLGMPRDGILFYREGINTTISVHRDGEHLTLRVNGKTDASNLVDMSTQVLLGEVPMLFGKRPERILVIGFASGITVGSVALHRPATLDVVDLEPSTVEASRFFEASNNKPLEQPGVRLIYEDGRNVLATTHEPYDLIISEPSNPWITGASNLFTREFFADAHRSLRPGGQLLQWVQLYSLPPSGLRAILASLQDEFPYVYGFARGADAVDLMLLARDTPLAADDLPRWEKLDPAVRGDLMRVGLFSTEDLWTLLRLSPAATRALAAEAPVHNSDDNMFVEILAPWALYHPTNDARLALTAVDDGILPVLAAAGVSASPEQLGLLALASASAQRDPGRASALIEAGAAGAGAAAAAAILAEDDENADARARLDAAVAAHPAAFEPRLLRAQARNQAEAYAEALDDSEVALQARPGDPRALLERVRGLNGLERYAESRPDAVALSSSPLALYDSSIWIEAATASAASDDLPGAVGLLRRYLERHPRDDDAWYLLSEYERIAGDEKAAAEAAENQRRALLGQAMEKHAAALRSERAGSRDEAIALLRAALEIMPDYKGAEADLKRLGG